MKILVVEDEAFSRLSLLKQIREQPEFERIQVLEASNGGRGLELFRRERPELVLTDIKMPVLGGIDMMKQIHAESPETGVVIISGYAEFALAQEALNYGARGYLLKPVKDEELADCIRRQMEEIRKTRTRTRRRENDAFSAYVRDRLSSRKKDKEGDAAFETLFPAYRFGVCRFEEKPPEPAELLERLGGGEALCALSLTPNQLGVLLAEKDYGIIAGRLEDLLKEPQWAGHAGISGLQHGASGLAEAHRQAAAALRHKLVRPQRLIPFDSLQDQADEALPLEGDLALLRYCIGIGSEARSAERLGEILARLDGKGLRPYEELAVRLEAILREAAGRRGEEAPSLDLLDYGSVPALHAGMEAAVRKICQGAAGEEAEDVAALVAEYVRENYNQDISLRRLAEEVFFLNHTYLSHLISERLGKSYSRFLREVRMDKARELLLDRRLAITEIASLCGYNNPSQFIQTFKKETGMTPKQFQNSAVPRPNGS